MEDKDIQKQGDSYEEESSPDILNSVMTFLPKKYIYALVTVVVIAIIGIAIYSVASKEKVIKDPIVGSDDLIVDNSYTEKQVEELRAAGYTGKEIEDNEAIFSDFDYLIAEAKKARTKYLEDTYNELTAASKDSTSDEFKELLSKTWLGGKTLVVSAPDITRYSTEAKKEIVDYIKLPARGAQLFLRLTLDNGDYVFMAVHPSRWSKLKDSGNIVVTYELVKFGDETFVLNLMEVRV